MPERFVNDLEVAAMEVEPRLAQLHSCIVSRGYPSVRMSGSGSALFIAFREEEEASTAQAQLESLAEDGITVLRTASDGNAATAAAPGDVT